jgi:hypothetical protein
MVWRIEKILADDVARPIIGYNVANTCWDPKVKGVLLQGTASTTAGVSKNLAGS